MQDVHRGPRVRQRPVVRRRQGAEVGGEGAATVVRHLVAGHQRPGQLDRVDDVRPRPRRIEPPTSGLEEAHIERGVVGHENVLWPEELQELGEH